MKKVSCTRLALALVAATAGLLGCDEPGDGQRRSPTSAGAPAQAHGGVVHEDSAAPGFETIDVTNGGVTHEDTVVSDPQVTIKGGVASEGALPVESELPEEGEFRLE